MSEVKLLGIYSIVGEGLIVELSEDDEIALYDKQGLQYRIISRQKVGLNTDVEESTLAQITSINPFILK